MIWDPDRYLGFADLRTRPGLELIDRINHSGPDRVVDLGCGTGQLTAVLVRMPDNWNAPSRELIGRLAEGQRWRQKASTAFVRHPVHPAVAHRQWLTPYREAYPPGVDGRTVFAFSRLFNGRGEAQLTFRHLIRVARSAL